MELASQQGQPTPKKGSQRAEEECREELASGTCLDGLLMLKAARNMEDLGDATVWVVAPQNIEFQSVTACSCLAMFCTMDKSCFRNYKCGEETNFGVSMKAMQQVVRATVPDDDLSFSISPQLDKISFTMKPKEERAPLALALGSYDGSESDEEKDEEERKQGHLAARRCGREAEFRLDLMEIDSHKAVKSPEQVLNDSGCLAIVSLSSRALHKIVKNISSAGSGDPFITITIEPLHEGDETNRQKSKISFRTYSDEGPINGAQSLAFAGAASAQAAKKARTAEPPTRLVLGPGEVLNTIANTAHFLRMARAAHRLMQEVRLKVFEQQLMLITEMGLQGRFASVMATQALEAE